jgi:hypothetical protein
MPRPCSVCHSPHRETIDAALLRGDSLRQIAEAFDIRHDAARRHRLAGHVRETSAVPVTRPAPVDQAEAAAAPPFPADQTVIMVVAAAKSWVYSGATCSVREGDWLEPGSASHRRALDASVTFKPASPEQAKAIRGRLFGIKVDEAREAAVRAARPPEAPLDPIVVPGSLEEATAILKSDPDALRRAQHVLAQEEARVERGGIPYQLHDHDYRVAAVAEFRHEPAAALLVKLTIAARLRALALGGVNPARLALEGARVAAVPPPPAFDAARFLSQLPAGLRVKVVDGQLVVIGAAHTQVLDQLREHKTAIIKALSAYCFV